MINQPQPTSETAPRAAFARQMLERPPTHDTVAGLERFRCLDLAGNLVLSRASCASRYLATTRDGRTSSVGSQATAWGPCIGCPVGKQHAAEQRTGVVATIQIDRGTVAKPGRVGGIRPGSYATRPEPTVDAPAAVVPSKRPSTRPEPQPTPAPERSDALLGCTERHGPAEVETAPASPPAGPPVEVSAGHRPRFGILTCPRCGVAESKRAPAQKWCAVCRDALAQERADAQRMHREAKPTHSRGSLQLEHGGITDSQRGWAKRLGITAKGFRHRIAAGLTGDALFSPVRQPRGGDHGGPGRMPALVERSGPVVAAERPATDVDAVETAWAWDGRVEALDGLPLLDAVFALQSVAVRLVVARGRRDVAVTEAGALEAEYRLRLRALVMGART